MKTISILSDSLLDFYAAGKKRYSKKYSKKKSSKYINKTIQSNSTRQEVLSRNKLVVSFQLAVNASANISAGGVNGGILAVPVPTGSFNGSSAAAQASQQNTYL